MAIEFKHKIPMFKVGRSATDQQEIKYYFLLVSRQSLSEAQMNMATLLHNAGVCVNSTDAILSLLCLCVYMCVKLVLQHLAEERETMM